MSRKTLTTHGRHDKSCSLAPGLFRSLKRGERKKSLDIKYQTGTISLHFKSEELLGADDLRVLQGVVAMASIQQIEFSPSSPQTQDGKLLASVIKGTLTENGEALLYCMVKTTVYRLAKEIGYEDDGGSQREAIINALDRMASVRVIYDDEVKHSPMDFVGYIFIKETGQIMVAVNPLIAKAIWVENSFVHIDMDEVRAITSDTVRVLHHRLCAVIDPGKRQSFNIDTLVNYVWPDEVNPVTQRKRRSYIRAALKELSRLQGWVVTEEKAGKYQIQRPRSRNLLYRKNSSSKNEGLAVKG